MNELKMTERLVLVKVFPKQSRKASQKKGSNFPQNG